jgi:hypothetical protein
MSGAVIGVLCLHAFIAIYRDDFTFIVYFLKSFQQYCLRPWNSLCYDDWIQFKWNVKTFCLVSVMYSGWNMPDTLPLSFFVQMLGLERHMVWNHKRMLYLHTVIKSSMLLWLHLCHFCYHSVQIASISS